MRRLGRLRGGFAGQPSNSWNQLPWDNGMNPPRVQSAWGNLAPHDWGFAGLPSNYWSRVAMQRIQYVMAPGFPSRRLVAKTTLSGWRGMLGRRRLGACPAPYTDLGDGCCYDDDGNRLTCAGGVPPSPAGVNRLDLPQAPTQMMAAAPANALLPWSAPPPPPPPHNGWQQFTDWLNQSTIPGVKNGYALAGAAIFAAIMGGRHRRR